MKKYFSKYFLTVLEGIKYSLLLYGIQKNTMRIFSEVSTKNWILVRVRVRQFSDFPVVFLCKVNAPIYANLKLNLYLRI